MFSWKSFLSTLEKPILGIVNVTPDSFFGDGVLDSTKILNDRFSLAKEMNIEFLDIGCISTKPNFEILKKEEELKRFEFFLKNMEKNFKFSIDSSNLEVITKALDAGFSVINDVSGFYNEKIISKAIQSKCGLIIVHRHPSSKNLHEKMEYKDVVKEVNLQLNKQVYKLINLGIHESQIAIDPGLGFGKNIEDSARLLLKIEHLAGELPIVVGYSNKRFLDLISLSKEALLDHCYNSGVSLVRLHIDK